MNRMHYNKLRVKNDDILQTLGIIFNSEMKGFSRRQTIYFLFFH